MPTNNATNMTNPVSVVSGGTGDSTFTNNTMLFGGSSSTNPVQSVAYGASTGTYLMSNGPSVLPSWQTPLPGPMTLIVTKTVSSPVVSIAFNNVITSNFTSYLLLINGLANNAAGPTQLVCNFSNGSTVTHTINAACQSFTYGSSTTVVTSSTNQCVLTPTLTGANTPLYGHINMYFPTTAAASYNGTLTNIDTVVNTNSILMQTFGILSYAGGIITSFTLLYTNNAVNAAAGGSISLYGII